ncbi:DUF1428 domain-containing protein [Proteobacteria bacterium 005FR1]|nr:DUF1428 domain-containing protein [Proteobacteria bacterium 005FR1]
MSYIDGFVIPVPKDSKEEFIRHAETADKMIMEFGALSILECWADDVPEGKLTDFYRAVETKEGETVVFAWIEWPSKEVRDAGMARMIEDPRMDPENNPMPFDGKRMIYGGFVPVVQLSK